MSLIPSTRNPSVLIREAFKAHDELLVGEYPELDGMRLSTVIDAGAALGGFVVPLLQKHPGTKVVCIEALPENAALLYRNVADFAQASIMRAALTYRADDRGFVEFNRIKSVEHDGTGGHCIEPFHRPELFEPAGMVPAVTVEEVLTSMGWDHVDLLKLDIEGEELDVIARMDKTRVRAVHLEWHLGKDRTMQVVDEHLRGWSREIVRDGEFGMMLLRAP